MEPIEIEKSKNLLIEDKIKNVSTKRKIISPESISDGVEALSKDGKF